MTEARQGSGTWQSPQERPQSSGVHSPAQPSNTHSTPATTATAGAHPHPAPHSSSQGPTPAVSGEPSQRFAGSPSAAVAATVTKTASQRPMVAPSPTASTAASSSSPSPSPRTRRASRADPARTDPAASATVLPITVSNMHRFVALQREQARRDGFETPLAGSAAAAARCAASPYPPATLDAPADLSAVAGAGAPADTEQRDQDSEEDGVYNGRVERQVMTYVDGIRGLTLYLDPCPPLPTAGLSPESSARAPPDATAESVEDSVSRPSSPSALSNRGSPKKVVDIVALQRRKNAEKMADRAEIEKRIRYITRDQLRQIYLETHEELLECIEDLVVAEARVADLDDELAVWEKKATLAEEELELARIHLSASDECNEALMAEKAEVMRKLTESKSELALLSARMVRLQQPPPAGGAADDAVSRRSTSADATLRASGGGTLSATLGGDLNDSTGGSASTPHPPVHDDKLERELAETRKQLTYLQAQLERREEMILEERARRREAEDTLADRTAAAEAVSAEQVAAKGRRDSQRIDSVPAVWTAEMEALRTTCATQEEELAALRTELRSVRASSADGNNRSSGSGLAKGTADTSLDSASSDLQEQLARVRSDLARCEQELTIEQQRTKHQSEVEARLLSDVTQLARQLRARGQLEREGRRRRRADADLSKEELIEEAARLRRLLIEHEARIAGSRRQQSGGESVPEDRHGRQLGGLGGSAVLSGRSGGTRATTDNGSCSSSTGEYVAKDYTAVTLASNAWPLSARLLADRTAAAMSTTGSGTAPARSTSARAAAITAAARAGVRTALASATAAIRTPYASVDPAALADASTTDEATAARTPLLSATPPQSVFSPGSEGINEGRSGGRVGCGDGASERVSSPDMQRRRANLFAALDAARRSRESGGGGASSRDVRTSRDSIATTGGGGGPGGREAMLSAGGGTSPALPPSPRGPLQRTPDPKQHSSNAGGDSSGGGDHGDGGMSAPPPASAPRTSGAVALVAPMMPPSRARTGKSVIVCAAATMTGEEAGGGGSSSGSNSTALEREGSSSRPLASPRSRRQVASAGANAAMPSGNVTAVGSGGGGHLSSAAVVAPDSAMAARGESSKLFSTLAIPGMASSATNTSLSTGHTSGVSGTLRRSANLAVSASKLAEEESCAANNRSLSLSSTNAIEAPSSVHLQGQSGQRAASTNSPRVSGGSGGGSGGAHGKSSSKTMTAGNGVGGTARRASTPAPSLSSSQAVAKAGKQHQQQQQQQQVTAAASGDHLRSTCGGVAESGGSARLASGMSSPRAGDKLSRDV